MNFLSIDLSLRSSGLSYFNNGNLEDFSIVFNKENDEKLLIKNTRSIFEFIDKQIEPINNVVIEGLSFGSISGSKDIIAGQFWYLRCKLLERYPEMKITIVPVTSWRNPLFTKEDRSTLKEAKKCLKEGKTPLKGLKGPVRKEAVEENKKLELQADIKEWTWCKLDSKIQEKILDYIKVNNYNIGSKYDICDSIFLGLYYEKGATNE